MHISINKKTEIMKVHLQKIRTQNGKIVKYSIPECGKRGSSNAFLHLTSLELFKILSRENRKNCCVNCLAQLN